MTMASSKSLPQRLKRLILRRFSMAPSSPSGKRRAGDALRSPPAVKRTVQSSTTKSAVASFFTPTSQKPKDRTVWSQVAPDAGAPPTLLVGRHADEDKDGSRRNMAAFDLDSTLVVTSSGKKHASSATDWKWWHPSVPARIRQLYHEQGYGVVILSNQAGLTLQPAPGSKAPKAGAQKRLADFKIKCSAVLADLDLPITLYAATERDSFRKPRTAMWTQLCRDYGLSESQVNLEGSFFVGDAGGRLAGPDGSTKDFSCSDRNFAHNVGIAYKTPEEFFLGLAPRDFCRELDLVRYPFRRDGEPPEAAFGRINQRDIILFCGPPGAGKSTFYWKHLEPLGYERVNQDTLKSREKCVRTARDLIAEGSSVVVDNTNADPDTRSIWVELAKKADIPIRCLWFKTPMHVCEHNDAVRALNPSLNPETRASLPKVAFTGFSSRFKEPKVSEGFQDVTELEFEFRGTRQDYDVWGRYWI